ncbi:hypothetical protein [Longibacter sp.]|uniref:hypothetical protein n=1 Tax=Longibacter sp. TaxID=2045415 RepID=UPI003EBEF01A
MPTHRGSTNETHQIQLDSAIEVVSWSRRQAAPGSRVGLQIQTHFVGNGAVVQIQLRDQAGTTFQTYTEALTANRLRAQIPVPGDAEDILFADITLPDHGLSATSPPLSLLPRIQLDDLQWIKDGEDVTEARRGDVLTLSASATGAPDGTEAELVILEHDADGAHDLVTRFPTKINGEKVEAEWEFEYVEDTDDIPADGDAEDGYQHPEYIFRVDVGGLQARSNLITFKDWFEIQRVSEDGTPISDERYVLHLANGKTREGSLDADGTAREEDLPPGPISFEFPDRKSL